MHRYALVEPNGFVVSYHERPGVPLLLAIETKLQVLDTYTGDYVEAVAA